MGERFINAAKDGYVDLLREANKRDLNTPDEDGMTATLWAAHNGNLEALRLIVGREGDVNKADYLGFTALHQAAIRGHMNVVSYLVHWGCNVFALDNDLHSALDLASMHERHDIVKFLDNDLAQRQAKNPKQVSRLKEEAMKEAEHNIKRYEKLQAMAAKRAEKETSKMEKEREQQFLNNGEDQAQKKSFFKTLTLRIKGGNSGRNMEKLNRMQSPNYSDYAGLTVSGKGTGVSRKIQQKRNQSPYSPGGLTDFRANDLESNGKRPPGSISAIGLKGSMSEVMYMTASDRQHQGANNLGPVKRPSLSGDFFSKSNLYKAKSESDLLDSGVDSYYGEEEDDENAPGMFNRPEFGKFVFLQKNPFLNTVQSFDDTAMPNSMNGDLQRPSGDQQDLTDAMEKHDVTSKSQTLPWDQDELGNLDDDEEEGDNNEFSAVNMFLWSCGLASYLHIFSQEKIDMSLLMSMTDSELKELGFPFGPRKKLREAIARRKTVLETPSAMTDTQL